MMPRRRLNIPESDRLRDFRRLLGFNVSAGMVVLVKGTDHSPAVQWTFGVTGSETRDMLCRAMKRAEGNAS